MLICRRMGVVFRTTMFAACLFMVYSTTAAAQTRTQIDVSALGPQVGDQVPDFNLPDQNGLRHTLQSVRGPNGSLILFYRSADW